jgi:hypothetical protein
VIRQAYALFNDEQFSEAEQLLDPGVVFELSPPNALCRDPFLT